MTWRKQIWTEISITLQIYFTIKKVTLDLKAAFKECFDFLKTSPRMYSEIQDLRLAREGYRKAIVKNYIGVYKVDDENKVVNMIRIVYGRMDYTKLV